MLRSFWTKFVSALGFSRLTKGGDRSAVHALAATPLETVLEDLDDAALVYDPDFTLLFMNRAAEKLFDIGRGEVVGTRMTPGLVEKPRYRVLAQTLFPSLAPSSAERSEAGAWPQVVTLSFENPHRELVATLHRLVDSSGIPTVFVKIVRDETRTREVFARQSELVGVAAHQLRTPLTALRWSLESARAKAEEAPGLIKEALALTDRCLKIVNDFLDAAKIEEGKFGLAVERVDLVMLIKPLVDLIAPAAKERRVSVSFSHSGLASLAASVDPSRLSTALLNFLDNAIRYNVSGGSVSIALERRGEAAAVTIADTGIGIPKGEERKLFKKLERGSNAIQVEPNGSGLGLYIARNIIASHGGSVTVASELNRGTSFTITIPLNTP